MIQFILNNTSIQSQENAGITLLDFIREQQQLKGTKIGCREGDCGACTVLVGSLENNTVSYKSITSCISPLGNANGKHIVTIEGVNLPNGLNTVQKAMVDHYGTQCGFCTPGFVVSMTGYALETKKHTLNSCNDAISGNICRCTGYKSIEKAGIQIANQINQKDDNNQIEWLIKEGFIPNYFKTIPSKLKQLKHQKLNTTGVVVANGTDLYVHNADSLAETQVHLIAENNNLKGIEFVNERCIIGCNTTVSEILESKQLVHNIPKLSNFLKLVSSEQIRNMGTLGGNFVNASPIGDMSIFFLALNAVLSIQETNGNIREIPFHEFHKNYKTYDLKEQEILKNISFNLLRTLEFFNFEKVSKRTHLDIASVNSAGRILIQKNRIVEAHFSVGGVAAIPKYLTKTNAFLKGKQLNSETIKKAAVILQSEISPISDVRGSLGYKRLLAKQLFFAHFIELFELELI